MRYIRRLPRWKTLFMFVLACNFLFLFYLLYTYDTVTDRAFVKHDLYTESVHVDELDNMDTEKEVDLSYLLYKDETATTRVTIKHDLDTELTDEPDKASTEKEVDLPSPEADPKERHAKAMEKISAYPHLRPYTKRLFRLIVTFKNRRKFDNIMTMFDQLVLHLWDTYNNQEAVRTGKWLEDSESNHRINCSNIHKLEIHDELGAGYIKAVYNATFMGETVAVKVRNMNAPVIHVCGYDDFSCSVYRDIRFLGEILLLENMDHPMLIDMFGYCVHSGMPGTRLFEKAGVVGVYPLGIVVRRVHLMDFPWRKKIWHSLQLSSLLTYAENSPFGPLTLYDFERHQFVWIDGRMYLSDMDVTSNELDKKCSDGVEYPEHSLQQGDDNTTNCHFKYPYMLGYSIDIPCVNATCLTTYHIHNMRAVYLAFYRFIFSRMNDLPSPLRDPVARMLRGFRHDVPATMATHVNEMFVSMKKLADTLPDD